MTFGGRAQAVSAPWPARHAWLQAPALMTSGYNRFCNIFRWRRVITCVNQRHDKVARRIRTILLLGGMLPGIFAAGPATASTVEFCLQGEFDLGARLQGFEPAAGEFYPARFCVTSEDEGSRVHFHGAGNSNPDLPGDYEVVYQPTQDVVRIVNRHNPPDLAFVGASIAAEALRVRRIDPRQLVAELDNHPDWVQSSGPGGAYQVRYPGSSEAASVWISEDGRLQQVRMSADMPLRGSVDVEWRWDLAAEDAPGLEMRVDGEVMFRGRGSWRELAAGEATALWQPGGGAAPREIPGDAWPARTTMQIENLAENVFRVRSVRTGFHHLVVRTQGGLVVADAPAGWVELPQIPPADLVPGLGVSGLSEQFVDFLQANFPDEAVRAVALTHVHDDHAGGARAFAAAGAKIYAPAGVAGFLNKALNDPAMPADRLGDKVVEVIPVEDAVRIDDPVTPVELINIGPNPHVRHALGLLVAEAGLFFQSDLHVPTSEAQTPRVDRLETECWFADWAVKNLPADTVVLNSHSLIGTPVSRLGLYLESGDCGQAGN